MASSETFLTTGLPAGRSAAQLFIDALISPRLLSDSTAKEPLTSWPDLLNWPNVKPTWEVVVEQDGVEYVFTATEVPQAPPYDSAAWQQLFPPGQLQQPYRGINNAGVPIFSYPAATVRDTVRDIHVNALINSRNEFPKVADLREDELFACMLEAANPETQAAVRDRQLNGPLADADIECHEAFSMADGFHGNQPGSTPPPVITSIDPTSVRSYFTTTVTIRGLRLAHTTRVGVRDPSSTGTSDGGSGGGPPAPIGVAATFEVVSDTEVRFETPIFTTTGSALVALTTPFGTATTQLGFVLPGAPSITSITPNRITTRTGNTVADVFVTVTGTNFIKNHTTVRLTNAAGTVARAVTLNNNELSETQLQIRVPTGTPIGDWFVRVDTPSGDETPVGTPSRLLIEQVITN